LGKEKSNNKEMGEVYQNKNNILIKAKKGSLLIKKIKLEGKKEMAIENFLNGYPDFLGTILK
jgi:methionyl-tRNA formyltransferase